MYIYINIYTYVTIYKYICIYIYVLIYIYIYICGQPAGRSAAHHTLAASRGFAQGPPPLGGGVATLANSNESLAIQEN